MIILKDGIVIEEKQIRKPQKDEIVFVSLFGASQIKITDVLSNVFSCHPLVIEDCVKRRQRPKVDMYKDHAFIPFFVLTKNWILMEVGIVIGENYVILIAPEKTEVFDSIKDDFLKNPVKMLNTGHILYEILDSITDKYFDLSDDLEDKLNDLEDAIYQSPTLRVGGDIFKMKRKLHSLRRVFSEERNVIGTLMHAQFPYTGEETALYLSDVHDHLNRVVETIDTFRESLTGLLEFQMTMKSDILNETMKKLTVLNTIFLPGTFIVGLYGINMKNVPELSWDYGYEYMWALIIVVTVIMWFFMKFKKWF